MDAAFLVPHGPAVMRCGADSVDVTELWQGWSSRFEGVIADDLRRVATDGQVSVRLAALADTVPAIAAILSWRNAPWLPLTGLDAVRLDGWDTLFLELLGQCNERCIHCYADAGPTQRAALDQATCEQIVDDAAALGFRRIQFTGGDPLLCGFLPELLARAAALPFTQREIYTNGLLLGDRLLDRLAPSRPSLAFSYYSHRPEAHDAITRTPGSQARTRAAIVRALARDLPVRVSLVVLPENHDDIDQTVAELETLGVTSISVAGSQQVGRGSEHAWTGTSTATAGHRSAAGTNGKLAITYDGALVPCIFHRDRVLGRIGPARLRDVVAGLAAPRPRRLPRADEAPRGLACPSCRLTEAALTTLETR